MGQEISKQSKLCDISNGNNNNTNKNNFNRRRSQNLENQNCSNEKYTKLKQPESIYAPTSNFSTSSASSTTDDEHYRQRQKYNFHKQAFEKTKVIKKFSNSSTASNTTVVSTSTTTSSATTNCDKNYKKTNNKNDSNNYEHLGLDKVSKLFHAAHQRRDSQSTDSGIYYSNCYCSSSTASSASLLSSCAISTTSGCSTSGVSNRSHKSLDKQKQYLNHHLYIKSYLDILEEDEKARANFKPARPGGIRNYTPKILAETPINISKPASAKLRSTTPTALLGINSKEDPWI